MTRDPNARCVVCGEAEHRDEENMVMRCYNFMVERIEPVYLRDLGSWYRSLPVAAS
jgi:hypothetical protein